MVAHELGEALVERRRALHVECVVGDLVEHRRGELDRVLGQRRAEERVIEPAEGREGAGGPKVDVVPKTGQATGLTLRRLGVEESLIRNSPDDGVLPGVRADAILRRSLEN